MWAKLNKVYTINVTNTMRWTFKICTYICGCHQSGINRPFFHILALSFFKSNLQFLTLAALDELGSSKSFQMTFLRLAQHIPSNGCGCKEKLFNGQ